MNYEEFKKEIIKCSNDEECIMAIHRSDENTRYNFKADEHAMYSSLWFNPLNEGFISWKEVEEKWSTTNRVSGRQNNEILVCCS